MKKERTVIYIKTSPERQEIVYSGIEFAEFIKYLSIPIENLLLINGDHWGNKQERNFELFEGREYVEKLANEDIYSCGDFCFVDYSRANDAVEMSDQQVAELLYMAHMGSPLDSPFFESLQNRFAYLAHDDGWHCKLYCHELNDFLEVLVRKITSKTKSPTADMPPEIQKQIVELVSLGIIIDLDELLCVKGSIEIRAYIVGEYYNVDEILNSLDQMKENAKQVNILSYTGDAWTIS